MTFPTYSTGTVSVSANGTVVTGAGTVWSGVNARAGDTILIAGREVTISDVTDATHLVLIDPWPLATVTGGTYKIIQNSPLRFAGGQAMADVSTLVAALNVDGFFIFVSSVATVPDPSLGKDGQYASQPATGKLWIKEAGTWTYLGIYKGLKVTGAWLSTTAYGVNDVVSYNGASYVAITTSTNIVPTTTANWSLLASQGAQGIQGIQGVPGATYSGTSTTASAVAIATGVTFTTQAGLAFVVGSRIRIVSNGFPTYWMEGYVTAYSGTTITVNTDLISGTGTFNDWNLSLAGVQGVQGNTGLTGSGYGGTSATSLIVATGSQQFSTQSGMAYVVGSRIRLTSGSNYIEGPVTAYSGTLMTINADRAVGSGTLASWTVSLAGDQGATGASYGGTSTTSLTIATGAQTFTTQAGMAYLTGARVRLSSGANYMEGVITSYSGTTMAIDSVKISGAGTFASWTINVAGDPGSGDMLSTNNLSELTNIPAARSTLKVDPTSAQVGVNWNTLTASGTYWVDNTSTTNAPASGLFWYLEVFRYSDPTYILQRAITLNATVPVAYLRELVAGVWTAWRKTIYAEDIEKKNYIINGAMMVSQENGATAGTVSGYYPADQWPVFFSTTGAISSAQVAASTPAGSPNRLRVTVTTADTVVDAGDSLQIRQAIEGLRVADLLFGSGVAKTVTMRVGVKAPAGTYAVSIRNGAVNRSYVSNIVIAAGEANTDVVKTVTIPGDVAGTWAVDNTIGFYVAVALMCGANFQNTDGAWTATSAFATSSQFNFMGTVGNVFELFDVGLHEGAAAPAFIVPEFSDHVQRCQRYWEKSYNYGTAPGTANAVGPLAGKLASNTIAAAEDVGMVRFVMPKRTAPTVTVYGFGGTAGTVSNQAGTDLTASSGTAVSINEKGAIVRNSSGGTVTTTSNEVLYHFKADARM